MIGPALMSPPSKPLSAAIFSKSAGSSPVFALIVSRYAWNVMPITVLRMASGARLLLALLEGLLHDGGCSGCPLLAVVGACLVLALLLSSGRDARTQVLRAVAE